MFESLLVPLDGSDHADSILAQVARLLRPDTRVTLLSVVRANEEHLLAARREAAEAHLETVRAALKEVHDVEATCEVREGDPAEQILARVNELRPALVAMASHGRYGPARWIRGSVAERVLRACPEPLLLLNPQPANLRTREQGRGPFKRILVPLDGSQNAATIVPLARAVAKAAGAEVVLLRASNAHHLTLGELIAPPNLAPEPLSVEDLVRSLEDARADLAGAGVEVRVRTAFGDPATEILEAIEAEQVDLVALTSHGRSGLQRWLFGSVAEKVLRTSDTPLLVKRIAPPPAG